MLYLYNISDAVQRLSIAHSVIADVRIKIYIEAFKKRPVPIPAAAGRIPFAIADVCAAFSDLLEFRCHSIEYLVEHI